MLCFKARSCAVQQKKDTGTPFAFSGGDEGETEEPHLLLNGFMNDLYQSLQLLIRALANYSIAFEALKGMRGISPPPLPPLKLSSLYIYLTSADFLLLPPQMKSREL